jgi:hypothetical protein
MGEFTKGKVRKITVNVTNDLYEKFKYKCYEEGYSMQQALQLLMENYLKDE